jgi:hypothetical protein
MVGIEVQVIHTRTSLYQYIVRTDLHTRLAKSIKQAIVRMGAINDDG